PGPYLPVPEEALGAGGVALGRAAGGARVRSPRDPGDGARAPARRSQRTQRARLAPRNRGPEAPRQRLQITGRNDSSRPRRLEVLNSRWEVAVRRGKERELENFKIDSHPLVEERLRSDYPM